MDELLFLSKVDSGALQSRIRDFSLADLLGDCAAELQPLAAQQNKETRSCWGRAMPRRRATRYN